MRQGSNPRPTRRLFFTPLALMLFAALLSSACQPQSNTNTTNVANTNSSPTASQTPQGGKGATTEDVPCDDDQKAEAFLKGEAEREKEAHVGGLGHDEPIIITDGSVHIRTSLPGDKGPDLLSIFKPESDDQTLTQLKPSGSVGRVAVVNHPNSVNQPECHPVPATSGTQVKVTLEYKDKDGNPYPSLLTVTTGMDGKGLEIKSAVKFSDTRWKKYPTEWVFEEDLHGSGAPNATGFGHKKVTVEGIGNPKRYSELHGNSTTVVHYWVQ
ncbi:MAG: hypothetical protein ACJ741_14605 [Pyrinomonadaceae bacterium]